MSHSVSRRCGICCTAGCAKGLRRPAAAAVSADSGLLQHSRYRSGLSGLLLAWATVSEGMPRPAASVREFVDSSTSNSTSPMLRPACTQGAAQHSRRVVLLDGVCTPTCAGPVQSCAASMLLPACSLSLAADQLHGCVQPAPQQHGSHVHHGLCQKAAWLAAASVKRLQQQQQ